MKNALFPSLVIFMIQLSSCGGGSEVKTNVADALRSQKQLTDAMISDKSLEVWVKVKEKKELIRVVDRKYPKSIEVTYNVLRDSLGRYRYIAELPFSDTNDWFISYKHYFDTAGHLYAFQRINNFLKSECVRGALMENSLKLYDEHFKLVDSSYTLTDTYKKPVDAKGCKFPYNFAYDVSSSLESYRKKNALP